METLSEQIEYGRTCKHGTPTGTPGGADLLCHHCEMGTSDEEYEAIGRFMDRLVSLHARKERLLDLMEATDPNDAPRLRRIADAYKRLNRKLKGE